MTNQLTHALVFKVPNDEELQKKVYDDENPVKLSFKGFGECRCMILNDVTQQDGSSGYKKLTLGILSPPSTPQVNGFYIREEFVFESIYCLESRQGIILKNQSNDRTWMTPEEAKQKLKKIKEPVY